MLEVNEKVMAELTRLANFGNVEVGVALAIAVHLTFSDNKIRHRFKQIAGAVQAASA